MQTDYGSLLLVFHWQANAGLAICILLIHSICFASPDLLSMCIISISDHFKKMVCHLRNTAHNKRAPYLISDMMDRDFLLLYCCTWIFHNVSPTIAGNLAESNQLSPALCGTVIRIIRYDQYHQLSLLSVYYRKHLLIYIFKMRDK